MHIKQSPQLNNTSIDQKHVYEKGWKILAISFTARLSITLARLAIPLTTLNWFVQNETNKKNYFAFKRKVVN